MTAANNRYARVRRTFYRGGDLKTDTTAIGRISAPLTDSVTRGQQYVYDLSGKRTSMQWHLGTNGYSYNDFGALGTITDPNSNQYRIAYTLAGQVDSLILGTGVKEKRTYDSDGRMTYRNRVSTPLGTLGTDTFAYDRMNRVIDASEQNYQQLASDTKVSYDGLGAVLANEQSNGSSANVEEFRNDPLGNVLYRRTRRTAGTNDAPFTNQYSPVGELMTSYSHPSSTPGSNERADTLKLTFQGQQLIRESQMVQNPNDGSVDLELATRHYFGADDKLMAVQRYSWRSSSFRDGTWEEYWYDALGRRVLTRARRDPNSIYDAFTSGPLCMGGIQCRSFTERVWWDGDQALVEERTPEGTTDVSNSGLVGNIHGLTLDEPLAVISDQTRIINYNWRGQGESSVLPNGQPGDASLGNTGTEIDWPALSQAQTYFTPGPGSGTGSNPKRWMGTFVANGQGTTGMLYRRNRYFSPVSGQFTQSDPIGIAGGMNAFGFAEGDPVNFSDPFGFCPNPTASGLGSLQCVLQDFLAGGRQALGNAENILTNAGGRLEVYVRGGVGAFSTEASVTGNGRPAVRVGPEVSTDAIGGGVGVRVSIHEAPSNSVIVSGNMEVGRVKGLGGVGVKFTGSAAISTDGSRSLTSVGVEVGGGLGRTSSGRSPVVGGSVSSPKTTTCSGPGCPPSQ
jgi:RHS repeat-associated protein